jgi:hypothetical protein
MSSFFASRYMPCDECGASVAAEEREGHTCDPERLLEYRLFQLRGEIARLDEAVGEYLDSPHGRFEQWLAERERRRGEGRTRPDDPPTAGGQAPPETGAG